VLGVRRRSFCRRKCSERDGECATSKGSQDEQRVIEEHGVALNWKRQAVAPHSAEAETPSPSPTLSSSPPLLYPRTAHQARSNTTVAACLPGLFFLRLLSLFVRPALAVRVQPVGFSLSLSCPKPYHCPTSYAGPPITRYQRSSSTLLQRATTNTPLRCSLLAALLTLSTPR